MTSNFYCLLSNLVLHCNTYVNDLAYTFSNPKTQVMVGIMELHDHLMFFILMIFNLKIIFFMQAIIGSRTYLDARGNSGIWFRVNVKAFKDEDIGTERAYIFPVEYDVETYKEFNENYVKAKVNNFKSVPFLEFIWTIFPGVILVIMAIPSFVLLYGMEETEYPQFNICAIGNQWYWSYEYMDFDVLKFYKSFVQEIVLNDLRTIGKQLNLLDSLWEADKSGEAIGLDYYRLLKTNKVLKREGVIIWPKVKIGYYPIPLSDKFFDYTCLSRIKHTSHKFSNSWIEKNYIFFSNSYLIRKFNALPFALFKKNTYRRIEKLIEDDTISIDCQIIPDEDLPKGYPRLLSTDNVLVLPTETPLRILVTGNDVIHSWSIPSFGIKMDGIPGRINQVFLKTPFYGTSWGQCSELCGLNHGFMPIEIRTVSLNEFNLYIKFMIRFHLGDINKTFFRRQCYYGFRFIIDKNQYWEWLAYHYNAASKAKLPKKVNELRGILNK